MSYILQLANNQKLQYPTKDINFYPTIRDHVIDVGAKPGDIIILGYPDSEFLYKVFTTNYLQINYNLDEFVRIANAVDFLGNDQILEQIMQKLVQWFNNPVLLKQFQANKTKVEDAIFNLNEGPIDLLLRSTFSHMRIDYNLEIEITTDNYDLAVSDSLEYVVMWGWDVVTHIDTWFDPASLAKPSVLVGSLSTIKGPSKEEARNIALRFINIYKNGQLIYNITNLTDIAVPYSITIDNNGILYNIRFEDKSIYRWSPPSYNKQIYKSVESAESILSNDAQRYLYQISLNQRRVFVVELTTGRVISVVPEHPLPPDAQVHHFPLSVTAAPNMKLFKYYYNKMISNPPKYEIEVRKNHVVWIVNENTKSWVDIPHSEELVISHDENIIAAYGRQPVNNMYEIHLYQREGLNFIPLANTQNMLIHKPIAVSQNVLLTMDEGDIADMDRQIDIVVNVYGIRENKVFQQPYVINIKDGVRSLSNVFSGPNNTYLFYINPLGKNKNKKLIKYRLQGYKRLNDFLVAKLGE